MSNIIKLSVEELVDLIHESIGITLKEFKGREKLRCFTESVGHEGLSKLWKDYSKIHKNPNYSNPLTIDMFNSQPINEALIKTYPIDRTVEYIKSYFELEDRQIEVVDGENGVKTIWIFVPIEGGNLELVKKAFNYCGYYLSSPKEENIKQNNWNYLVFAPKVQDNINNELRREEKFLYHLTPSYNRVKIEKIGLCPRYKNKLFNYPERIYLLRGSAPMSEIINLARQLYKNDNGGHNTGKYTLFKLSLDKIPERVNFRHDDAYKFGIYTNDNIGPDCIIKTETIKI